MGNNSVPKFIFLLSRFPVYRGSVLGRFYCISLKWNSIKDSGFPNQENSRNCRHDKLCCVCMREQLTVWSSLLKIRSYSGRRISHILCNRIYSSPPLDLGPVEYSPLSQTLILPLVVHLHTTCFNINKLCVPPTEHICFIRFSQSLITALNSINQLLFVIEELWARLSFSQRLW